MSQILNGRRSSAKFDSDGVRITRSGQQVDIPLPAIEAVRAAEARTVEIVLTDGTVHRVEGDNPTATTAFVDALSSVLPEKRDPSSRAVVTDTSAPRDPVLYVSGALLALLALGYIGYAVWVTRSHGARVVGVIIGLLPLLFGAAMLFTGVQEAFRRIVLARRGITVLAEAVGREGKKNVVYRYTTVEGADRTYSCKRNRQRIHVLYDPQASWRAIHADWLPFVLGRVVVLILGSLFWLFVGVVMIFGVLW
ncbi:hypothetical protein SAMN05428944_7471 [Streptomyces sp. 1222.5]|uniref:DUF3592 domain-containing protein n=1 Tax=unclassified Streptomyces TaxID=2593676 RepID=UPI000898C1E0|nr:MULTISPECIES: DUF3592 domain-containing protein [unclassified Streptomyces]PKW05504.1 hypothetical protein BX260_0620 [Streptomyces sp. 5112.2]SED37405.1 hypothetical protein SAMN05428944_7471 [Streptomyces sp. 1222.5]